MRELSPREVIEAHQKRVEEEGTIELAPHEGSLDLLQKVYRNPKQPITQRIRCAIEALPFEHPKLSAVAHASLSGNDFATMLDRAVQRSLAGPPLASSRRR
jgi:hypothetical protein